MSAGEYSGALGRPSRPPRAPCQHGNQRPQVSQDCWEDEKTVSTSSRAWDDPEEQISSARRGIRSLRPLETPPSSTLCSQDVRLSGFPQSQNNNSRSKPKPFLRGSTNSRPRQPQPRNGQVSLHIESRPPRANAKPSVTCELIDPVGMKDVCNLLASIRCNLQDVRAQLALCVSEYNTPLFNDTTWAFLLPTGELFLLEETKPLRSPKPRLAPPTYRLFGKPLVSKSQVQNNSKCLLALYTSEESALVVLGFLEKVLSVVFLDRDGDPSQSFWDREMVPSLDERLKVFFLGPLSPGPGDEKLVALSPRPADVALEIDHETKSSTVAALGRLDEEPELPARQSPSNTPSTSSFESEDETDEDEEEDYAAVEGSLHPFPGYTLTLPQGQREAFKRLVREATPSPLVFRNHYTALGPESCLRLREASCILSSSPLALTAGCSHSSQISEALSAELLVEYGLRLRETEMELTYLRPSPKIDFTCTHASSGTIVGVSVTRAFKGDASGKSRFSSRVARALVAKKLNGLNKAWESIKPEQRWRVSVLHVWAPSARNAARVEAAFREHCAASRVATPVLLLLTSTSFDCPIAYAYIYNHFS